MSTTRARSRRDSSSGTAPRLGSRSRSARRMSTARQASRSKSCLGERIQVMVVGLGMVGIAFIEKLLTLDVEGRYFVRTCGEEPTYAYNRVGLTEYFQHRNIEDLYLNDVSWYAQQNPQHFAFHIGEQVRLPAPELTSRSPTSTL